MRRRQVVVAELLRHARIVTDPETLAGLAAEVARRKGMADSDLLKPKTEPRLWSYPPPSGAWGRHSSFVVGHCSLFGLLILLIL